MGGRGGHLGEGCDKHAEGGGGGGRVGEERLRRRAALSAGGGGRQESLRLGRVIQGRRSVACHLASSDTVQGGVSPCACSKDLNPPSA